MSNRSGAKKAFLIDLSTARSGKQYKVKGKLVRISNSSGASAEISIATSDNIPDRYETLRKNGRIIDDNGFEEIYITNDAQANQWVRVIVSEGDYDVDNPAQNIIDEIAAPVTVQEILDPVDVTGSEIDVSKSTVLNTVADVAILTTATTQVLAANAARRTAIISNLVANGTVVRVGDASVGAARGAEIPVGGSAVMESTEAIFVYNPSGGTINIGICWSED